MSTPALVRTVAPEFKAKTDQEIAVMISVAALWADEDVWADKYDAGVAYLTAHLMTIAAREGAAGSIASETVGRVSVSFSNSTMDDELADTGYGKTFLSLRRTIVTGPLVSGEC